MAYYDDGYMWAQEHNTFFPVADQDQVSFSSYEPYGHVDTNYGYDYDYDNGYDYGDCHKWYSYANPTINYLEHNYMEAKLIAYEPVVCDTGYISYHTHYSISYAEVDSGFNEPEFGEYDPTPYDGGYDIISVYGKPLPPSDQTCYPRSKPNPIGPKPTPNIESQPKIRSSPEPEPEPIATPILMAEPEPKPKPESVSVPEPEPEPIATPILMAEPKPKPKPEPEPLQAIVPLPDPLQREEYSYPGYEYDYPWPEYDNAHATRVGYDYGYGKHVVQIPPCEYSPEVVDFCESIFGNWPCLARIRKQQMGNIDNKPQMSGPEIGHLDPWEDCASYIFGHPRASYNVC